MDTGIGGHAQFNPYQGNEIEPMALKARHCSRRILLEAHLFRHLCLNCSRRKSEIEMSANQKPSSNQAVILTLARAAGFTGINAREITALQLGDADYDPVRDNIVMASISRSLRRLTRRKLLT